MTKNILLVCNAGMSTSILVRNMQKAAAEKGLDCSIEAKSLTQAKKELSDANVVLLEPRSATNSTPLRNWQEIRPQPLST